jgi:hypothetical protein
VEFRFLGDWPQFSLDLNYLDFSICSVLQAKVQATPLRNLAVLHLFIAGEWDPVAAECIRKTCRSAASVTPSKSHEGLNIKKKTF